MSGNILSFLAQPLQRSGQILPATIACGCGGVVQQPVQRFALIGALWIWARTAPHLLFPIVVGG